MEPHPELSVIVPLYDEEDNVRPLVDAVRKALGRAEVTWELVLVDDGSRDRTRERAAAAAVDDPRVRLVVLARNYGQSTAMQAGFDHSRGRFVVTMDGDLQNDPGDILRAVRRLRRGFDLVAGYRVQRRDRFLTRTVPSWVANRIIAALTGIRIRDNGCSLKAYRRELLERMRLYSDMHRFIPALAVGRAGARITEIPVRHHPRLHGTSKYGLARVAKVLTDLLTIKMIRSFQSRPLRLAGGAGLVSTLVAGVFALGTFIGAARLDRDPDVVLIGAALVSLSLGVFLLFLGLVGESAIRHRPAGSGPVRPLVREVLP